MKAKVNRLMVACVLLAGSLGAADALKMADWREVRLAGSVGESADRCIAERTGSDWARGDMYEECVNSFRTHWDDSDGHVGWQNEYWGKTMLCFAGAIAYTGDAALADWVKANTRAFLAEFQKPNGYLSTYFYEVDTPREQGSFTVGNRHYKAYRLDRRGEYEMRPALRNLFRIVEDHTDEEEIQTPQASPADDEEIIEE